MSFSIRDFIAGWSAGVCGILVGHPSDTIKVRQQVAADSSLIRIVLMTAKNEGIRGFYRGMLFPLVLSGTQKSIFFGVYGNTLRILQSHQNADVNRKTCGEGSIPNSYWHLNVYMSGFTAAFVHSFLAGPVDLIKIIIQAQRSTKREDSRPVQDAIKKIYSNSGIKGFSRGLVATFLRDVPSYGLCVLLYEHFLSFGRSKDNRSAEYSISRQLVAGGLAGTITWVTRIPADVVKSRIQADSFSNPKYRGTLDCFIKSYKEGGLKVFARGFWIHILRSFPVSASTFFGYELCWRIFKLID